MWYIMLDFTSSHLINILEHNLDVNAQTLWESNCRFYPNEVLLISVQKIACASTHKIHTKQHINVDLYII